MTKRSKRKPHGRTRSDRSEGKLQSPRKEQFRKRKDGGEKRRRFPARPYTVIFEDSDILVISKEAGLLSVPFQGARSPNALDMVNEELEKKHQHAHVVHRIDRYTSGLLLFAKHQRARELLVAQFMAHTPERDYLALLRGKPKMRSSELVHHMKLSKNGFRQMIVKQREKGSTRAHLHYQTVSSTDEVTLVRVKLFTGLKNQIRVQFAAIGNPIVGDRHYVGAEAKEMAIDRQALHAAHLAFTHPRTKRMMHFEAPLTKDFVKLLRHFAVEFEARPSDSPGLDTFLEKKSS